MKTFASIVLGIFLFALVAFGHHSFAGGYDLDQHATIRGTVTAFNVRNPHSFVSIEVQDQDGKTQTWGVEWAGATQLRESGVGATTLSIGDKVVITGAPSKDIGEKKLLMQRIIRSADQWKWEGQIGRFKSSNTPLPPIQD